MEHPLLRRMRLMILHHWVRPLERVVPRLEALPEGPRRTWLLKGTLAARDLGRLAMSRLRVNVKRLVGPSWSVIYIGEEYSIEELRHTLFPEPAEVEHLERAFLWEVPVVANDYLHRGGLVVCELNRLVAGWRPEVPYCFLVPPWVRQVIPLDRPLEGILARMNQGMRRNLRKLWKRGFAYHFTQELADFDRFYHEMYLPYVQKRHGARAVLSTYGELEATFRRGGLLLVTHEGEPVSGMLGYAVGETWRAASLGVYQGSFEWVTRGAITAVFWYMLEWACQQGARFYDMGSARARLGDGVFNFKRQWGARVSPVVGYHTRWLFLARELPVPLAHHLTQQGFLAETPVGYQVVVINQADGPTAQEVHRLERMAAQAGAAGLLFLPHPGLDWWEQRMVVSPGEASAV